MRSWHLDTELRSFEIELTAYEVTGEHVRITLSYGNVRAVRSSADPEAGLPGPYGYGHIGYDEIHLIDGKLEHWFLFSSGIEMQIAFEFFQERAVVLTDRQAAG